ncbi:MAG: hypothetical protein NZ556_04080 [Fimbriimonadales bacterium]|nr:hypothetical protein [Fimbriimonadales bacterium]
MIRGRRNRRTRGSMMLEVVIASALSVMVLALLVSVQYTVLRSYQRTVDYNTADRAAYNALREIRELAQQAVSVSVSNDGTVATLFLPRRDTNGRVAIPVQADTANPVVLRANFAAGQLTLQQNGQTRLLLANLSATGGQSGNLSYTPFQIRQIAPGVSVFRVRLSVRQAHQRTGAQRAWYEETILLRNAVQN